MSLLHEVAIGVEGVSFPISKHRHKVKIRIICELREVHKGQGVGLALNVGDAICELVAVLN